MAADDKKPTITIELLEVDTMLVSIDFSTVKSMAMTRCMLYEAQKSVDKYIADLEAAEFGAKMNAAAQAHRAMQKMPKLV